MSRVPWPRHLCPPSTALWFPEPRPPCGWSRANVSEKALALGEKQKGPSPFIQLKDRDTQDTVRVGPLAPGLQTLPWAGRGYTAGLLPGAGLLLRPPQPLMPDVQAAGWAGSRRVWAGPAPLASIGSPCQLVRACSAFSLGPGGGSGPQIPPSPASALTSVAWVPPFARLGHGGGAVPFPGLPSCGGHRTLRSAADDTRQHRSCPACNVDQLFLVLTGLTSPRRSRNTAW